jgi:hypothetical protein
VLLAEQRIIGKFREDGVPDQRLHDAVRLRDTVLRRLMGDLEPIAGEEIAQRLLAGLPCDPCRGVQARADVGFIDGHPEHSFHVGRFPFLRDVSEGSENPAA